MIFKSWLSVSVCLLLTIESFRANADDSWDDESRDDELGEEEAREYKEFDGNWRPSASDNFGVASDQENYQNPSLDILPYGLWRMPERKNLPLTTNGYDEDSITNSKENDTPRKMLTEYVLRRNPITRLLQVVKVIKYNKDNAGDGLHMLKEISLTNPTKHESESHNSQETNADTIDNSNIEINRYKHKHKHVKKQLNETEYESHKAIQSTISPQGQGVWPDDKVENQNSTNSSLLVYKMFRKKIPLVNRTSPTIVPLHTTNNELHPYDSKGEGPTYSQIHRKKTSMCIGNSLICKNLLKMSMWMQSMLGSKKYTTFSQRNTGEGDGVVEDPISSYLKLLSVLLRGNNEHDSDSTSNKLQGGNGVQVVMWRITNPLEKVSKEDWSSNEATPNRSIYNATQNITNITAQEEIGDAITQNNLLLNKDILNQNIKRLWKSFLNEVFNDEMKVVLRFNNDDLQVMQRLKTISEYVMNNVFRSYGFDIFEDIDVRNMWTFLWDELFSHMNSAINNSTNGLAKDRQIRKYTAQDYEEMKTQNEQLNRAIKHFWKALLDILFNDRIMKYMNIDREDLQLLYSIKHISENIMNLILGHNMFVENSEYKMRDIKDLWDYMWNELFARLNHISGETDGVSTELTSINENFSENPIDSTGATGEVVEEHDESTEKYERVPETEVSNNYTNNEIMNKVDVFNDFSAQFENASKAEIGTSQDRIWEDLLHNILYKENEIRDEDSVDDRQDLWETLKEHLLNKTGMEQENYNKEEDSNDIWKYIVNRQFGSGSEIDSDLVDGHRKAWDYIQQLIENFTNPTNGRDEIWNYLISPGDLYEMNDGVVSVEEDKDSLESETREDSHNSKMHLPTAHSVVSSDSIKSTNRSDSDGEEQSNLRFY